MQLVMLIATLSKVVVRFVEFQKARNMPGAYTSGKAIIKNLVTSNDKSSPLNLIR
jgi:hypothetical protein